MNNLFNVHVYVDYIIIGTKDDSMEDHIGAVNTVINRLTEFYMIPNPQKCHSDKKSVHLLSLCIFEKGKSLDPRKLTNIADWPCLCASKEMMQWLGTVNYFCLHISRASVLTASLDASCNVSFIDDFEWTPERETHFQSIKDIVCNNIVFSPPDITVLRCY